MKKKNILVVILLLAVIATGICVSGTYAKYTGETEGEGTAQAAAFVVKVDNNDLTTSDTFELVLTPEVDTTKVVEGKMAPTMGGYFDIVINPAGSEVALEYSISNVTFAATSGTAPSDLAISGYKIVTGATADDAAFTSATLQTTLNTLATAQELGKFAGNAYTEADTVTVRVYWNWVGADDDADTAFQGQSITVTGTVTVSQDVTGSGK